MANETSKTDRKGVSKISDMITTNFEWVYHDKTPNDKGIDGEIEIYTDEDSVTGKRLSVQIKSGESYIQRTKNGACRYNKNITEKHKKYWIDDSLAVILICYSFNESCAYWVHVNKANIEPTKSGEGKNWKIIPNLQKLDLSSKNLLVEIASTHQVNNEILYRSLTPEDLQIKDDIESKVKEFQNIKTDNKQSLNTEISLLLCGLSDSSSFYDVKRIVDACVSANVEMNVYIFEMLISKSEDYKSASELYKKLVKQKITPNTFIFAALISKTPSQIIATHYYDEMLTKYKNIKPNVHVFFALMNKCESYEGAEFFIKEMKSREIVPNEYCYLPLIRLASPEKAFEIYEKIKDSININQHIYDVLIRKATTDKQKSHIVAQMEDAKTLQDRYIQTSLAAQYNSSPLILREAIKKNEIIPDQHVFAVLASKAGSKKEIKELENEMKKYELTPSLHFIGHKIKWSDSLADAKNIYEKMIQDEKNLIVIYITL